MPHNADLAGLGHWESIYRCAADVEPAWRPRDYNALALARALVREVQRIRPESILEVGCGNSTWLPYLAMQAAARRVAGIDYSPTGVQLARQQLQAAGVAGDVFCADLFTADVATIGQYDLVYSLGLVEHFADTLQAIDALLRFVRPGGTLIVEVPNLFSLHGLLMAMWQPRVLHKHKVLRLRDLGAAYRKLGLAEVRLQRSGLFSLAMVSWGVEPRFPRLERALGPAIRRIVGAVDGSCA